MNELTAGLAAKRRNGAYLIPCEWSAYVKVGEIGNPSNWTTTKMIILLLTFIMMLVMYMVVVRVESLSCPSKPPTHDH